VAAFDPGNVPVPMAIPVAVPPTAQRGAPADTLVMAGPPGEQTRSVSGRKFGRKRVVVAGAFLLTLLLVSAPAPRPAAPRHHCQNHSVRSSDREGKAPLRYDAVIGIGITMRYGYGGHLIILAGRLRGGTKPFSWHETSVPRNVTGWSIVVHWITYQHT
jgi:hypothetical protein